MSGQHVTDRIWPYQPQVPGAEFGLGAVEARGHDMGTRDWVAVVTEPEALALSRSKIDEIHDTLSETLVEYDSKHEGTKQSSTWDGCKN
jgi:hypothetical protein